MEDHKIFEKAWMKAGLPDPFSINPVLYASYIFSHEFTKAFWGEVPTYIVEWALLSKYPLGEGRLYEDSDKLPDMPAWQYHLQQMVLEENPLKYLEKFL